jgi:hypothetical protein
MGWGGKRPGAGRKPNAAKAILAKTIEEAGEDAKAALGLLVMFYNDPNADPRLRRDCANDVMDRVWGKPTQRNENENSGEMIIRVVYDDPETDTPTPSAHGADAIQG